MKKLIAIMLLVFVHTYILYSETQPERPSNYYAYNAGTEANPYLISNLANLRWLSEDSEDWWKGMDILVHFRQTADIDASETANWHYGYGFQGIGHPYYEFPFPSYVMFFGVYDGGNHTITNLYTKNMWVMGYDRVMGVFYRIENSTIKNLHLVDLYMKASTTSGGIAGTARMSSFQNCSVSGEIIDGGAVGGILGAGKYVTLQNCYTDVDIISSHNIDIGGIVGKIEGSNYFHDVIQNCYSLGNVSGGKRIGGIFGDMSSSLSVINSYTIGNINTTQNESDMGGIGGRYTRLTLIEDYYSAILGCIWNLETTEVSEALGYDLYDDSIIENTHGLNTTEMKQFETYLNNGWDFENIWWINPDVNNGYPYLIGSYYPVNVADFNANSFGGFAPLTVQFDCKSAGRITSWSWDFNSDGIIDSTEQNPIFIYEEPGTYSVTLTINDGENSITKEDYIVVLQQPIADFTAEIVKHNIPLEVQFIDLSVGAVSWFWDFGVHDAGNVIHSDPLYGYSTEQNPVFTYTNNGSYTVTLTINDGESSITKENFIETTVNNIEDEIYPLTTQLSNNYPNPFNPETTINFSIGTAGHVKLEIFNIRGQKVKILVDDFKEMGAHSVVWNGTDDFGHFVSSGVYFYSMTTNGYSNIKRMILLK